MRELIDPPRPGLFRRAMAAMGYFKIEAAAPPGEARPNNNGGWLAPAGATVGQILDYVGGTGDMWPLDFYRLGLPINRDAAVSYATLNRCVTLISGAVAQLVAGGNLQVVDSEGRRRRSRRADRVVEVLSTSPDGGVTPAYSFIEDAAADYCLDGNALIVPSMSGDGMLGRLRRMSAWDADLAYSADGEGMYRLAPADGPYFTEHAAARDVIHVRWPRLLRHGRARSAREGFALAPVVALRPALDIGIQGDRYIREWFARGSKSKMHFDLGRQTGERPLTGDQRRQIRDWIVGQARSGRPIITQDVTSSSVDDTPQDDQAGKLREFQVAEVARVFGVPAPLLGEQVTEWGAGIEQLAKLFYRFGARQHLERFLAPFATRLLRNGDRFRIDTTDLLRGDADAINKTIMALQGDAQRGPVATREELRHVAGLPRDPDGEFVQVDTTRPTSRL